MANSSYKHSINLENSASNSFLKSNSLKLEVQKVQNDTSISESNLKNTSNDSNDYKILSNIKKEINGKSNMNGLQTPQFTLKLIKIENTISPSPQQKCINKEMYTENQKWTILNNQIKKFYDNLEMEESKNKKRNNNEVYKKNLG